MPKPNHNTSDCIALCPSCQQYATFAFAGIQNWPEAIVAKTGRPAAQTIHVCSECGTSVTDVVPAEVRHSA